VGLCGSDLSPAFQRAGAVFRLTVSSQITIDPKGVGPNMVDMMFAAASRLMRIVGKFACAPRKVARLPLSVSISDSCISTNARRRMLTLAGRLENISETGIAMVLPSIRLGDYYLAGADRTLCVALELTTGPLQLNAAPVRYERIEKDDGASVGYLIGAQIKEISENDRKRLNDYLRTLR
jgi:hypothetical protein